MHFRLFLEDGFDGPGGTSWDILYPSTAGDYVDAASGPREHSFLQWKWNRGLDRRVGRRPLYNIDNDEFQKRTYVTIESPTAPDTSDGFWQHKEDTGESYLKVKKVNNLIRMGYGKDSNDVKEIEGWHFYTPTAGGRLVAHPRKNYPDQTNPVQLD